MDLLVELTPSSVGERQVTGQCMQSARDDRASLGGGIPRLTIENDLEVPPQPYLQVEGHRLWVKYGEI